MPKCDFNQTSAWVFSCKLLHIFKTPFSRKTSGGPLLKLDISKQTKLAQL